MDAGSISGKLGALLECWERLGMESAPSVPKTGTVEAFGYGKCGYRPKIRDVGNTLGMLGVLWVDVGSYFEVE